ncbi:hypothetical protein E2C01_076179 [Portunus trituberculatus]|uniref:Uncharacterized protein n=1 Tax=Portunus trituberculatus TaxID=210409 RepID=A0A5B7IH56_PORTR|nr:hypothetical protein [Portunus trituberculatus]
MTQRRNRSQEEAEVSIMAVSAGSHLAPDWEKTKTHNHGKYCALKSDTENCDTVTLHYIGVRRGERIKNDIIFTCLR